MIDTIQLARIISIVSFIVIVVLKGYMVLNVKAFQKSARVAMSWTVIYFSFLIVLRLLSAFRLASTDDLIIISALATLITMIGISYHLFLVREMETPAEIT